MLYKLTDQDGYTRRGKENECKWGPGVKHIARGPHSKSIELCTNSYIHCYENPLIAVIINPVHANIKNPILWEAKGFISKRKSQLKAGCFSLTTTKQIELPIITVNQQVRFAIYCALELYKETKFILWTTKWLNNTDRNANTANAAARAAASVAASAAANAAAYASVNASDYAAYASARAAYASANAADYAAYAVASGIITQINFIALAKKAIREELLIK